MPVGSSKFDLVIFDCDGVLVDSERIANRVLAEMLNDLGLPVTLDDMFERFVGHPWDYCLEHITRMLGRPVPNDFEAAFHTCSHAALAAELTTTPGIEEALDRIALPFCVASSGSHDKMRTTLGATGLLPRFEGRLFSVTEVPRGKPFPDVYLYAAHTMGAAPHACAVVEDTHIGVAAGVAAGMTVLGYAAATPPSRLIEAGARTTFEHVRELPNLIL